MSTDALVENGLLVYLCSTGAKLACEITLTDW